MAKEYLTVKNIALKNKRVLVRVDFNVPLTKDGRIRNDKRIKAALPTINYILSKNPKYVILISHLGKPKGMYVKSLSLKPVATRLSNLLKQKVSFVDNYLSSGLVNQSQSCKVILLENLRFHAGEELNDKKFAKHLSRLADVYINDAFGTAHRKHASVDAITNYLPSAIGLLFEKELKAIHAVITKPKKPLIAIIGAAKISDKIHILKNLFNKTDKVILAGGIVFTFLKALGYEVGKSLTDDASLDIAQKLYKKYKHKLIMPLDFTVADNFENPGIIKQVPFDNIPANLSAYDIGKASVKLFKHELNNAKTIIWNGPLGMYEYKPFDSSTRNIAKYISSLNAVTIIGGGDTASAISKFRLDDKMYHVSTGGGAFLKALEGKDLIAMKSIKRSYIKFYVNKK